jgi:hypothetical protein
MLSVQAVTVKAVSSRSISQLSVGHRHPRSRIPNQSLIDQSRAREARKDEAPDVWLRSTGPCGAPIIVILSPSASLRTGEAKNLGSFSFPQKTKQ